MFEKIVRELGLGNLISTPSRVYGGLTHKMYSVETDKGHFAVKILNENIMKRPTAIEKFRKSDTLECVLENNNIPCVYSMTINGKKMSKIDKFYIYVYNFYSGHSLSQKEIGISHVKKISEVMARIHNIDFQDVNALKIHEVDFKKYIKLSKEKESVIYSYIFDKLDVLNNLLNKSNEAVSKIKPISCICHNDLDSKNVLWKNDEFKIIDLECLCYSNPYKELFEMALSWSGFDNLDINYDLFKEFIKTYKENTKLDMNIDWEQIYYTNNGMLFWLEYNIKRALKLEKVDQEEKELGIKEVKNTIDKIMYYNNNKDMILNIIKEIVR